MPWYREELVLLGGKDLVCFSPPDRPSQAGVLLALANSDARPG